MSLTREMIVEHLQASSGINVADMANDEPLFSSSLIDSFAMVDLIGLIERETGSKMSTSEIHLSNLDTLERILAFAGSRTDNAMAG